VRRLRPLTLILGALGAILAVALFVAAEPVEVLGLVRSADWRGILVALAWASGIVAARGARLRLVVGARLSVARGSAVMALAQLAVSLIPMRMGELAIVPLLRLAGVPGTLRALSVLVLLRFLDVASLLVLTVVAATFLGLSAPAAGVALVLFSAIGLTVVVAGMRSLRVLAARWRTRRGLRRRFLRQALQLRREWRERARSPFRVAALVVCSIAAWVGVWGLTVALLRAMGFDWKAGHVLLGMLGASVGASLPFNAFGNFGTLEGGWAAALSLVGVPASQALATGFATHLYSLVFTLLFGAAGALLLAATSSRSAAR
jgi:uncharacterized membrane protein YbhN (UPF0104 family)